MEVLFLAWRNPKNEQVFPIGRLTYCGNQYQFVYIKGALKAKKESYFHELASFPHLEKVYKCEGLFPVFSNRLMPRSRPDYKNFIKWIGLSLGQDAPLVVLARSGGKRMTDNLETFSYPEIDEKGNCFIFCFAQAINILPEESIKRIERLFVGEELLLTKSLLHFTAKEALLIKTKEFEVGTSQSIGCLPDYLTDEIFKLLEQSCLFAKVERVNLPPVPIQFRLLCRITFTQPNKFSLFTNEIYQPIST